MRKSANLLGPAAGVAGGDFGHHLAERIVEVDRLGVRETDHHEQNVCELHRDRPGRLVGLLGLWTKAVINFARELAHFFREARDVDERGKVPFLELRNPSIHGLLRVPETHEPFPPLI